MATPIYYPPTQNGLQKTLDAQLLTGVTASATLNNVVGIQNKKGIMVIDRVDGNNNLTPSKREYISFDGTSGSTVVTLVRGLAGSTDQDHAVGAIVEFISDITQQQAIIDGLLLVVDTNGALNKATGAEVDTGTDDAKIVTPKAMEDSSYAKTTAIPVKASGAEITTGTDDAKFATPKAMADADVNTRLKSKMITFTRDIAGTNGDVSYTGVGFTPTSLHAMSIATGGEKFSIINADSSKKCSGIYQSAANTIRTIDDYLIVWSDASTISQLGVLKSYDADGFTITWSKGGSPTGTLSCKVLCYR